jgi:hypothetical protein
LGIGRRLWLAERDSALASLRRGDGDIDWMVNTIRTFLMWGMAHDRADAKGRRRGRRIFGVNLEMSGL